ncbi:CHAT domain-containing protein [Nostoc sphaeroides]|uniref:CHAT domain-containing protein n=1 Tax=Nostoc sphaeroides CCNUC1 TaxID=2653204 RepID=A0A5P8WGJ3_9NOSO|nr:CHAT domain-containing protein [Nostoc sphaeroides]QFS51286.1 CHAT domain-containing protein [Nostoc sphaeroides CCNUC1]
MKILHIDLKPLGSKYAEFRFFWDNPNNYQSRQLPLTEIAELIEKAETDYYTELPEDYAKTGQTLYNWLDGSDRIFQQALDQYEDSEIVLAIATTESLAHLPWEVLHNGDEFLVEHIPAIVPVRWRNNNSTQLNWDEQKKDRALNVLFMATSPFGIEPVLEFEAEEGHILDATKRIPLSLTVEESGSLDELNILVKQKGEGDFDVFHLTGHATKKNQKPCFITETELGEAKYSSAEDIASKLQPRLPKIIFLSGCRTGYSNKNTVPTMAETLLKKGATAVLSWGDKVRDSDAIKASETLYKSLTTGDTLAQAVAQTYQKLIEIKARDWHLLRLYVAKKLPGALVTPGLKVVSRPSVTPEFLDSEGKVRVATRENFIGRRRQLQNCLRSLKTSSQEIGVLIHGMGGLGKSTIASRLCDRLFEHTKIVWWRQIDESSLVQNLAEHLENKEQRTQLGEGREELKFRLKTAFSKLKPLVLVFDDFEWNLEPRDGRYILNPKVSEVLSALVWAIKNQENISYHRIIITCRYDFEFESDLLRYFYKQPLEGLRKADLQKKLKQLDNFNSDRTDKKLIERALKLADGNPRLLEWLNLDVLSKENVDSELSKFEASSDDWKSKIIWITDDAPKLKIDSSTEKIVSRCLVFEIPVPMTALEAVCKREQLNRAIQLGLIEVSPEPDESKRVYLVSRIIPHIIPTIHFPEAPGVYSLYQKAHEKLHELWGNKENKSKEKWQEIFRLKFANKENPERFRQGFYQMLAVQYNSQADKAFEGELRKCASELVKDGLCTQLENYLQQKQWKEADEETAWIFYQVMVRENYEDWGELLNKFPCETLREINQLWLQNSSDFKFGISIQAGIYQSLGGTDRYDREVWEKFTEQVGWNKSYNAILEGVVNETVQGSITGTMLESSVTPSSSSSLLVLIYTKFYTSAEFYTAKWPLGRDRSGAGGGLVPGVEGYMGVLFSRAETCKI